LQEAFSPVFPGCEREPVRDSQATVLDVTPRTHKKSSKNKLSKSDDVQTTVQKIYVSLREAACIHALPAAFHSSFVNGFKEQLTPNMSVGLFAGTDDEVLGLFADIDLKAMNSRCVELRGKAESLAASEAEFKALQVTVPNVA